MKSGPAFRDLLIGCCVLFASVRAGTHQGLLASACGGVHRLSGLVVHISRFGTGRVPSVPELTASAGVTLLMTETTAMLRKPAALMTIVAATVVLSSAFANADQPYTHQNLKGPSEFMSISSATERSLAFSAKSESC